MIHRFDKLALSLPAPDGPDANAASCVQELLGGKFGELSTFRDSSAEAIYHHQRVPLPVEQLTFWHRQSFVAGPFRGSTTRNVDPTPSLLTSSMRPPNRRTRRRVMARPSPTPGSVSRQVEAR